MAIVINNQSPADGALSVGASAPVEFDVFDDDVASLGEVEIDAGQLYFEEDLSDQVDGVETTFTVSPFADGTIEAYADGVLQQIVSTTTTTITLANAPLDGSELRVVAHEPYTAVSVDLSSIVVEINGIAAFTSATFQTGYDGTIEPILGGYRFSVTHPLFSFGVQQTVSVEATTLNGEPGSGSWSFSTSSARNKPYILSSVPDDADVGVPTSQTITFVVRSDDTLSPASDVILDTVRVNGTLIYRAANMLPAVYSVASVITTTRQREVTIDPVTTLEADKVYVVEATFHDDAGSYGSGSFAFSTGTVDYAVQVGRQEPLLCPIGNLPIPLFSTGNNVQTVRHSDTVSSPTTNWERNGLTSNDFVEITSGKDAGFYVVRERGVSTARLFKTFSATSTGEKAKAFRRQEFADRNPVKLMFSPLFDYKLQRVYGDTNLRFFAGNTSDVNFPVSFHDVPAVDVNDANRKIAGTASMVNDSEEVTGVGTSILTQLDDGSLVRFGTDQEIYTVSSRDSNTAMTLTDPVGYRRRVTGTVSLVNGSKNVTGTGTYFLAELALATSIGFSADYYESMYGLDEVTSNATARLATAWTGPTTTVATADVFGVYGQAIYKLDNSLGGTFDDQTNKRLDFRLSCATAVSDTKWDRYSVMLGNTIATTLPGTATVVNASTTVTMSNPAFKGSLVAGSSVTFGGASATYTVTEVDDTSPEFSITPAWSDVGVSGLTVRRKVGGTRVLTKLRVTEMPENGQFMVGLAGSGLSPTQDINKRMACSFVRRADGMIELRAHLGQVTIADETSISVSGLLANDWLVELEMLDENTMRCSVISYDDLTRYTASVTVENAAFNDPALVLDRWTITTLSPGLSPKNSPVVGYVEYIDVEHPHGAPFTLDGGLVTNGNAKARPARNVHEVPLAGANGWKTLSVQAGMSAKTLTTSKYDRIFWDVSDVVVIIDSFDIEGGKSLVLSGANRSVKKFSLNQGFDTISLSFRASRRGYWYAMIDSTDPANGLVAARGIYQVADSPQQVTIDADAFGSLADGLHTITVVLCKEPVVSTWGVLPATSRVLARSSLLKGSGVGMYGIATINASADVIEEPEDEEEIAVVEDLSSQVTGAAASFISSSPYRPGKLRVYLDGVLQNFNPSEERVEETNNEIGQFTLDSAPRAGQVLVIDYVPIE